MVNKNLEFKTYNVHIGDIKLKNGKKYKISNPISVKINKKVPYVFNINGKCKIAEFSKIYDQKNNKKYIYPLKLIGCELNIDNDLQTYSSKNRHIPPINIRSLEKITKEKDLDKNSKIAYDIKNITLNNFEIKGNFNIECDNIKEENSKPIRLLKKNKKYQIRTEKINRKQIYCRLTPFNDNKKNFQRNYSPSLINIEIEQIIKIGDH